MSETTQTMEEDRMDDVMVVDDLAPWLELLPADVGTPEYRADVRHEARARKRHGELAAMAAELEEALATGLSDPAVNPRDLTWTAVDLAATRALASALPPVVPVEASRHDEVRRALPRPYRGAYLLPHPPAYCAELVHHQRIHAMQGEIPPVPGPLDTQAITAYEAASVEAAAQWASLAFMDDGHTTDMATYVRAWSEAVGNDGWSTLHYAIGALVDLVDRANAARPPTGTCAQGNHGTRRLQPPESGDAWSFADAVRNGMLVTVS